MRIPPLHEAQAHLAGAGWRLLPQTSEIGQIHGLKLLHRDGNLVEEFSDVLRFWLHWLDFAAYTLSHHRCVDVVVTAYQRGSGRRRKALIRDLEAYLNRTDRSGIERLVGRVGRISPIALPRNWKSELISILNGPYPKPNFCITVVDALIELDPKLGERWGNMECLYPGLAAMRATITQAKAAEATDVDPHPDTDRSSQQAGSIDGGAPAHGEADGEQEASDSPG